MPMTNMLEPPVALPKASLREMIRLVRVLYALSKSPAYFAQLKDTMPDNAQFDPCNDSVLMGYDFHLSPTGPKLIEVNNNVGGLWLAWQAHFPESAGFEGNLRLQLLAMFLNEYALWCGTPSARPHTIAIIDEQPATQFLYPEMQMFAALFAAHHFTTFILDPAELTLTPSGLDYLGTPIDLIYNRHCDFYLQSAALRDVRHAWLQRQVCLTPNPHTYALLADKQRMCDWTTPEFLSPLHLPKDTLQLLERTLLQTRLLATQNRPQVWHQRKFLVFKPTSAYASRGVYLGKKITTAKFAELDAADTLVQDYVVPSTHVAANGQPYKVDFRLFVYQHRVFSVAARLYQGQVTNLRTEGGGFARVHIE